MLLSPSLLASAASRNTPSGEPGGWGADDEGGSPRGSGGKVKESRKEKREGGAEGPGARAVVEEGTGGPGRAAESPAGVCGPGREGPGCTLAAADSARAGPGGGSAKPAPPGLRLLRLTPHFIAAGSPAPPSPRLCRDLARRAPPWLPRLSLGAAPAPHIRPAARPRPPSAPRRPHTLLGRGPRPPPAAASTSASGSGRPRLRGRPTPAQPLAGDRPLRSPAPRAAARPRPGAPHSPCHGPGPDPGSPPPRAPGSTRNLSLSRRDCNLSHLPPPATETRHPHCSPSARPLPRQPGVRRGRERGESPISRRRKRGRERGREKEKKKRERE